MTSVRTRIKICGLTREEDIHAAVSAGADAIGLVCFAGSKRYVPLERAAQLRRVVPAFVSVVALFVNAEPDAVRAVIKHVQPDLLQFHGDESPSECEQYGHPYLRALRVGAPGLDTPEGVAAACAEYSSAAGWLFDSYTPGYGGSGQSFDRALLAALPADGRSIILSGGLKADNAENAVRELRPWAVDVSSGVESAPGIKSCDKIRAFVDAVRRGDE